jgi:hypothetical protein
MKAEIIVTRAARTISHVVVSQVLLIKAQARAARKALHNVAVVLLAVARAARAARVAAAKTINNLQNR